MNGLTQPELTGHTRNRLRPQDPYRKRAETRLRGPQGPCPWSDPSALCFLCSFLPRRSEKAPQLGLRKEWRENHGGPRSTGPAPPASPGEAMGHSVWGLGLHQRQKRKSQESGFTMSHFAPWKAE